MNFVHPNRNVRVFAAILAMASATALHGQDAAKERLDNSPRHQEWIALKHDGRSVETFVVYPEVSTKAAAVIVIHENRGLNDWARSVADRLASEGYIALAPDLLTGMGPHGGNTDSFASPGDATKGIYQLKPEGVLADLNAVADYAKSLPACDGRLAVVGFCWGGSQTWRFVMNRGDLAIACPFYGVAPDDPAGFARIGAPVHAFYGGNDERVDATIDRTTAAMKAAGKTYDPVIYDGAGHAYMRAAESPSPNESTKAAAAASWKRLLGLLSERLK